MRGARGLLLLAIIAILGWLGFTYRIQRRALEQGAPARPDPLPAGLSSTAEDWYHRWSDEKGRKIAEAWAKDFRQEKDSSQIVLERVRLHFFHKDGQKFDLIESPAATLKPGENTLYADGEVSIIPGLPSEGEPTNRLVKIRTSGVTFDVKSNRASTDRPADFTFENGTGKCVGAVYDPTTKELLMRSNVELNMRSRDPKGEPIRLESGQLVYKELDSLIVLSPWARMKRGASTLEGADTVVNLKDGRIDLVETQKAKGVQADPDRRVDYSADRLFVHYTETGDIDKVEGHPNARVVSTSDTVQTTTTTDKIELAFSSDNHQANLTTALAHGHAVVESRPLAAPAGHPMPDTRILRSEEIELKMRPGGREIDEVATHAPGHVEFLPNNPASRRREMDAEWIYMHYGPRNIIRSFRAVNNVRTRTDPSKPKGPPRETWSTNMQAEFNPATGQLVSIHQWDNFRYAEGDRKATAGDAKFEQDGNLITLETAARVWDPTGSTAGDTIHLDQSSGDFDAQGHVSSSRVQDSPRVQGKPTPNSGLLSGSEPVQATAERMTSTKSNKYIRYEGKADLWQGANRIRADRIDIDREAGRLVAAGSVRTQLLEKEKAATAAKPGAPSIFTIVNSAGLVYTESDRLAYYTGGVTLTRPELQVKSLELRSFLSEANAESSLDRAYADGKVEIRQTSPGRLRTGSSEHAEYYVADQKIILKGGNPQLVDSVKGSTRGSELTYFAGDDRLMVNGAPEQPAKSRIRRK